MAGFCQEHHLDLDAEFQLNLVVEELFVNSVQHGGCEGLSAAVSVRFAMQEGRVEVVYADRGLPFDPTSAPAPDLEAPLADRGPGRLGIHLVRQIMRDIEYRREPGMNILTMYYPLATQQERRCPSPG